MTIKQIVEQNLSELRQMSYKELVAFGSERWNSAAGFGAFKRALQASGIDFYAMKMTHREIKRIAQEESITVDYNGAVAVLRRAAEVGGASEKQADFLASLICKKDENAETTIASFATNPVLTKAEASNLITFYLNK